VSNLLAKEDLERLLSQKCISSAHPWCTEDERQIDGFYKQVCADIERAQRVQSRIEWNHYGSGYASYVDAWFYRATPEFECQELSKEWQAYHGVAVLLSRLSSYFVVMEGAKTWSDRGGSNYLPTLEMVNRFARPATERLADEIAAFLETQGLQRLHPEALGHSLPKDTKVPTILSDGPYTVFDAVFYWED
jgi:hypothetical protein